MSASPPFTEEDAKRRAIRLEVTLDRRSREIKAAAWLSCFGEKATGSLRARHQRALRIASAEAVMTILNTPD